MRETTALIYSPKLMTTFSFKLDKIKTFSVSISVLCRGFFKNLCHFEMGGGGLENADVIRGGRSMLTVADRGRGGGEFAKILLTSYVIAPYV